MEWFNNHWLEIALALFFALIVDALRVGSSVRRFFGWLNTKLAERSIRTMEKRISELATRKRRLEKLRESDKAQYLLALRYVLWSTGTLAIGMSFFVFSQIAEDIQALAKIKLTVPIRPFLEGYSLLFLGLPAAVLFKGLAKDVTSSKADEHLDRYIDNTEDQIADLKHRLAERLHRRAPTTSSSE